MSCMIWKCNNTSNNSTTANIIFSLHTEWYKQFVSTHYVDTYTKVSARIIGFVTYEFLNCFRYVHVLLTIIYSILPKFAFPTRDDHKRWLDQSKYSLNTSKNDWCHIIKCFKYSSSDGFARWYNLRHAAGSVNILWKGK